MNGNLVTKSPEVNRRIHKMTKSNKLQTLETKIGKIDNQIKKYNEKIDSLFLQRESILNEKEQLEKDELWEICQTSGLKLEQVIVLLNAAKEENTNV